MVSSQILPSVTKDGKRKLTHRQILLPVSPPDVVSSEQVELDFSDVFGPLPVNASNEVSYKNGEVNELVYDDPEVICNRSHSLVGPSACVSQSLNLSGLTIHETEEQIEFLDSVMNVTCKKGLDVSKDDSVSEVCDSMMKTQAVGLEDFEVLKVVGQGAFAKVYQVKKRGTSEIYAMKVMRKDKIMEKNHAEYMKAERDILTKIDHPFVVQLRYSFQVRWLFLYLSCKIFKFIHNFRI